MSSSKLILVALMSAGLLACSQDRADSSAPAATQVAADETTPTAAAPATATEDEGYSCEQGMEQKHAEGEGCSKWDDEAAEVTRRDVPDGAVWVAFDVDGMTCGGCERRIQAKVGDIEGVVAVEASAELGRVRVAFAPGKDDGDAARARINELGYKVR